MCSGLSSTLFYLLICSAYIWFASSIPRTCNVPLKNVFFGLGVLNGVMGAIMACFVCVAKKMLSAMSHGAIADKYRIEGREDEALSEESDYESEAKMASKVVLMPSCLYLVVMNGLLACWAYGLMQVAPRRGSPRAHHTGPKQDPKS